MTWKGLYSLFESVIGGVLGCMIGVEILEYASDLFVRHSTPIGVRVLVYGCLSAIGFRLLLGGGWSLNRQKQETLLRKDRFSKEFPEALFLFSVGFFTMLTGVIRLVGTLFLGVW